MTTIRQNFEAKENQEHGSANHTLIKLIFHVFHIIDEMKEKMFSSRVDDVDKGEKRPRLVQYAICPVGFYLNSLAFGAVLLGLLLNAPPPSLILLPAGTHPISDSSLTLSGPLASVPAQGLHFPGEGTRFIWAAGTINALGPITHKEVFQTLT